MHLDVAGLGNALMDALVVVDDDSVIDSMGLARGTMHPVDHDQWQKAFERFRHLDITFDSGGSCANTVATVGRLGGQSLYCGNVGDDSMGRHYADLIAEACGAHALRFSATEPTGKCLSIISSSDAERTMLTDLGASIQMPDLGPFSDVLQRTQVAHFTGYTLLPGPMQQVVTEAIALARQAGAKVSIDAADPFVVVEIRDRLWQTLTDAADLVFLNADEARQLTGKDPETAIDEIAETAALETVVIKLGAQGALVRHQGETTPIQAQRVDAIDTTGAGDAFAGGYLYGVTRGWSARRCGMLGAAVAARTVSQIGAVVRDREVLASLVSQVEASGTR